MKVFITDDSPIVYEWLIAMLSNLEGNETLDQAQDVSQAISSVEEPKPDPVIMDIHIPGGNGIDVLAYQEGAADYHRYHTNPTILIPNTVKDARIMEWISFLIGQKNLTRLWGCSNGWFTFLRTNLTGDG